MRRVITLAAWLCPLLPGVAAAQACLALPALASSRVNLSASAGAATGTRSYGGRVGSGWGRGFGGVTLSRPRLSGTSWATTYAIDAGLTLPRNPFKSIAICPVVQAWYQDGPVQPTGSAPTVTQRRGAFVGLAFGDSTSGRGRSITPFYEAGLLRLWTYRTRRSATLASTLTAASASGGAAVRFGPRFVVAPSVTIPIGLPGGDPYLSVRVSAGIPPW